MYPFPLILTPKVPSNSETDDILKMFFIIIIIIFQSNKIIIIFLRIKHLTFHETIHMKGQTLFSLKKKIKEN